MVKVMDGTETRLPSGYRHPECLKGQGGIQTQGNVIANHLTGTSVQYRRQINKASSDANVGDIGNPHLV
jgi:hypothetical protein